MDPGRHPCGEVPPQRHAAHRWQDAGRALRGPRPDLPSRPRGLPRLRRETPPHRTPSLRSGLEEETFARRPREDRPNRAPKSARRTRLSFVPEEGNTPSHFQTKSRKNSVRVTGKCKHKWDEVSLSYVILNSGKKLGTIGLTIASIFFPNADSVEDAMNYAIGEVGDCECLKSLTIYAHGSPGSIKGTSSGSDFDMNWISSHNQLLTDLANVMCPSSSITLRACDVGANRPTAGNPLITGKDTVDELANDTASNVRSYSGTYTGLNGPDVNSKPNNPNSPKHSKDCAPPKCCDKDKKPQWQYRRRNWIRTWDGWEPRRRPRPGPEEEKPKITHKIRKCQRRRECPRKW